MAKAFEFRLEKLLQLRRLEEEAAQRELAAVRQAVEVQNEAILGLLAEADQTRQVFRSFQERSIDVGRLRQTGDYLDWVERLLRRERSVMQDLEKAETEKRGRLTEALKGVRVLERFRERQLRQWQQGLDLEERKFLDEIGQNLAKGA
jgi:flagellar FliJ protein